MPPKSGRGGKARGKPRIRRPRARKQQLTTINRSLQPIANRYICKMKYAEVVTTDSTAVGQYVMNLNSLFDPNRTGGGHQPYGFDQLAALYNRYRVIACGWRVSACLLSTSPSVVVAAMPSNDVSIVWNNFGELIETSRAKYITQNPGAAALYLQGKSYLPTLMGRTRDQYMADDQYQAIVTTSPTENALLYLQSFDNTGAPLPSVRLNVVLEYTVEFFDPKRITQS